MSCSTPPPTLRARYPHRGDLITGLVPKQEVSILAGSSGAGKTTVVMQLTAAVQKHQSLWDLFTATEPLQIGLIGGDRSIRTTLDLAERAGADLSQCHIQSLTDDRDIDITKLKYQSFDLLLDLIRGQHDAKTTLLLIDPLVVFFGGDTKLYTSNAVPLIRLNRLCNDSGLTIIGTHHATKARTDYGFKRRQDRIGGSGGALQGFSSTQLFLDTPEEAGEPHSVLRILHHLYPSRDLALQRTDRGLFEPLAMPAAPNLDATGRAILDAIPATQAVRRSYLLANLPHIPPATLDRHLANLTEQGHLAKAKQGEYSRP